MKYGYKHTTGVIFVIVLFIVGCITVAYSQTVTTGSPNTPSGYSIDSTTGNLIPNGALTSDTGWVSTTGAPTWTAYPAPQGSFGADGYTFSYPTESIGVNNISLSGFNHGYLNSSAVFVTGFSYGLTYRFPCANSIGTNCDGTSQTAAPANPIQDNLRVEIGYYPATGNAEYRMHQLGLKNINDGNPAYNPTWQTLTETWTFAGAKPLAQAGAVNMEIRGNDAGGWACLGSDCYGPQVKNAYIRANYSVDPCILNAAFNPSCPGFNNVIQGVQSPVYWHSYNIAQRLPHIGGGVQLHGFEYGFNWANYGACYNTFLFWCTDWRTDGGATVNFSVTNKNNVTLYSDSQYRGGNNQSGSYYNRFLFTETQNSLDMGNVNWSLSGVWNHLAVAGWTRPIWTPDPCYFNGLYSPNCTNFRETLNQVIADVKAQQERIGALTPTATLTSSTNTPDSNITTVINASATNPSITVTTTPTTTTETSTAQGGSAGQNNSDDNSLNNALALIRNNDRREQGVAMQASRTARNEAAAQATRSEREAQSVAASSVQQSQRIGDDAAQQAQQQAQESATAGTSGSSSTTMVNLAPQVMPVIIQAPQTQSAARTDVQDDRSIANTSASLPPMPQIAAIPTAPTSTAAVDIRPITAPMTATNNFTTGKDEPRAETTAQYQPPVQNFNLPEPPRTDIAMIVRPPDVPSQVIPVAPVALQELAAPMQMSLAAPQAEPAVADSTVGINNFITNRTNPITEIVEGRQLMPDSRLPAPQITTVNRNAQPNEAAVGVDIDRIAIAPTGFNVYASLVLRDAAFYAPKEIYRGQRNVDNVRALRNLAQDRRHGEMVDQQYRR
jgi:hypothetical protein